MFIFTFFNAQRKEDSGVDLTVLRVNHGHIDLDPAQVYRHLIFFSCSLVQSSPGNQFEGFPALISSFQAYSQSLSKVYERELRDFFEGVKQRTLTKGVRSEYFLIHVECNLSDVIIILSSA